MSSEPIIAILVQCPNGHTKQVTYLRSALQESFDLRTPIRCKCSECHVVWEATKDETDELKRLLEAKTSNDIHIKLVCLKGHESEEHASFEDWDAMLSKNPCQAYCSACARAYNLDDSRKQTIRTALEKAHR